MCAKSLTPQELDILVDTLPISTESPFGLVSPILGQLATAGRDALDELMTEMHYGQGDIVFKEGEAGTAMYIIWSGRVAVVKGDFRSPIVLGYRGTGEIIGEMALLEDRSRSASIIALEDTRMLRIGRQEFSQLLSNNPSVGMGILGTLSARLRAADDARGAGLRAEDRLSQRVTELQTEKQQLLELEQLRQETADLLVHDLRHPLSSLFGIIKLFEMVLPEEVLRDNQSLLDLANTTCAHMQLLVDSLLDIARMQSGEVELDLEEVNLKRLIEQAVNKPVAAMQEQVTLNSFIPTDLPLVIADREKIKRVLANLIGNAIKYTPTAGKIIVAAKTRSHTVEISVTDNGPGIPLEDRERIFERFARVSENNTRGKGFGLGLAFCKLAVESHGGHIWVEPGDNDVGSRFIFTLPLCPPTH